MITVEQTIDTARKVIAENPDTKNPINELGVCLYNGGNGTHCIAGTIFVNDGFDTSECLEGEGVYEQPMILQYTEEAINFLDSLQALADTKIPWGEIEIDDDGLVSTWSYDV